MEKSLVKGSPLKCIISFAVPVLFGLLFQQLYNMVDTMIVGHFLGLNPLAGVGSTSSLYFLVIGSCTGICGGFAIPVSQMYGANSLDELRRYVANGIWLSVGLAAVLTTLTVSQCRNLLNLMNTPAQAYEYAYMYIVIIFAGIPTTFLYNISSSIIRALGDSRSPVVFLVISSIINIALDLLFILVLNMNVAGAALATVLSQLISGTICTVFMMRKFSVLRMTRDDWRPRITLMRRLCAAGLPMGLQYSITAIGSVSVQTAVNSFGEIAVAGVTAANKVYNILCCPQDALGATMATFAGQNIGAGRLDRVTKGLRAACITGFACSLLMLAVVLTSGRALAGIFLNANETQALDYAQQFMRVTASGLMLLTIVNCFRFTIQGMGYSTFAMLAGVLEMIARCFVAFGLARWFGFSGVCFSNICAWFAADCFLIPAFFSCRKRVSSMATFGVPRSWKRTDNL